MAELGYQQGRNFTFEYIQSPGIEGYELNYRELVARKVDMGQRSMAGGIIETSAPFGMMIFSSRTMLAAPH